MSDAGTTAAAIEDCGATPSAGRNGIVGDSRMVNFVTQERAYDKSHGFASGGFFSVFLNVSATLW